MTPEASSQHFEFKIVIAGAFAVGKTTLISTISDREVVGTEVDTTGTEAAVKATTTVGMEYGTFSAGGDGFTIDLSLFGVPGQRRFSFMWDIVARGMDALLLLVDASRPDTWAETLDVGAHFRQNPVPTVIAVNRGDEIDDPIEKIRAAIPMDGVEYVACDPRDPDSARNAIVELLFMLLDSIEEQPSDPETDRGAEADVAALNVD